MKVLVTMVQVRRNLTKTLFFIAAICLGICAQAEVVVYPDSLLGQIKPMNAANNGPIEANFEDYAALKIPYARTHDTALGEAYGGHCVDISLVFPDFNANVNDPRSYDFAVTDVMMKRMIEAGTKPFFRLGQSIEHQAKKYGIYPPKDYRKWARICEHIVRHYNEGWADGFHYDIEYWEIWNEPDLDADGRWKTDPRTWAGTQEEFNKFYVVASSYLKSRFPDLKIGGPAFANILTYGPAFLDCVKQNNAPLDFCSWHIYHRRPYRIGEEICKVRKLLDEKGFTQTESILNEWNFVRRWDEKDFYSERVRPSVKAAAFVASVMCIGQHSPIDMLMYYDLRPNTTWNGAFSPFVYDKLPVYYSLYSWAAIAELSNEVKVDCPESDLDYCAAIGQNNVLRLLVSRFNEDRSLQMPENVLVAVPDGYTLVSVKLLDSGHMYEAIDVEIKDGLLTIPMERYSVAFVEMKK